MGIAVTYHVNPTQITKLYKNVGTDYSGVIMVNPIHSVPRDMISKYDTKTLYSASVAGSTDRAKLEQELYSGIQERIEGVGVPGSVVIEQVSIRNIDFPQAYKDTITSKMNMDTDIAKKKLEVTVDELCKGHPEEFREFMNFCRKLQFTEDPDYKYVLGLFEGCMKKNGWDPKVPDFIWNKNRLVLEKEALKQNLMKVISKPIKKQDNEEAGEQTKGGPEGKKIDKNSNTVRFTIPILDFNDI
jgi:hypothetical protein